MNRVDIQVLTELNSGAMLRVIVIVMIYRGFNRAELGCIVRVIVNVLIYTF